MFNNAGIISFPASLYRRFFSWLFKDGSLEIFSGCQYRSLDMLLPVMQLRQGLRVMQLISKSLRKQFSNILRHEFFKFLTEVLNELT